MPNFVYRSEDLKEYTKAMCVFNLEVEDTVKDKAGNFGDYLTKAGIIKQTKKLLAKNGFTLDIGTETVDGHMYTCIEVMHVSGQFRRSYHYYAADKDRDWNGLKVLGGIKTYISRYEMAGLLNIDGGEGDIEDITNISPAQCDELYKLLASYPEIQQSLLESLKIQYIGLLKSNLFDSVKKRIAVLINQKCKG